MANVVAKVKSWFFDRKAVENLIGRKTAQAMAKGAALVRKIARNSMRRRKAASAPGQPPSAHKNALLKELLFFSFDPGTQSAVIGPTLLNGSRDSVPAKLERGGKIRRSNRRHRVRQIGEVGPIRIGGPSGATTHTVTPIAKEGKSRPVQVTFGRLHTAAQVDTANRINAELYGPAMIEGTLAPRPYMGPALVAAAPSLPSFYSR